MPMYYTQFLTAGFWDALVDKLQEANGLNPAPLPAELKAEAVARVWYNVKCVLLVVFLVVGVMLLLLLLPVVIGLAGAVTFISSSLPPFTIWLVRR